jgi:hypothetical protein
VEWKEAKAKRNHHRNEATRLKRKYARLSREARKVEGIMHSATSALQKMGSLKRINNRRRAPPTFLNQSAINRFQRFWSNMYDGTRL